MTKETPMTNNEVRIAESHPNSHRNPPFVIRASSFFRHLNFDIALPPDSCPLIPDLCPLSPVHRGRDRRCRRPPAQIRT
jgi:hypothetical protein